MRKSSTFPMPLRSLLALVVGVLVAHAMLLGGYPTVLNTAAGPAAALEIRQIEALPATTAQPIAASPAATEPTPAPATRVPRKMALPPASLKPDVPVAQQNIAGAAPEIIATTEPISVDPPAAPTLATPTEPIAQREEPPAAPNPASTNPGNTATAGAPTDTPDAAELAQREADSAQRRALRLQFPASGALSYNATQISGGQPKSGSGTLNWTTDGSDYQLRLESSMVFVTLLTQTSVGKLGAEGLLPERFSDKRFNRSEKAAHFQRDAGKITFSGSKTSAPLQSGAQDRLSVLMQLAAMAAGSADQLAQAGQVSLQVANTEEADTWLFTVNQAEKIQVPAGQAMALHMVRNPRKPFDSRLEVWLAPNLGYLPVRILQTEANGNTLELQLRSPALR
jgi:Protein of unknown function (DUF3108)